MLLISINKRSPLIILLLLLFQSKSFGQDFQWVYTIIGKQTELQAYPNSQINDVIVDKLDNIYITGNSTGKHDFSNDAGNIVIDTESIRLSFIIKLNKNKTVLWVKYFTVSQNVNVMISKLHLDQNQNLLLTGGVNHTGAPFIDLNPNIGEQQTIVNPTAPGYGVIIKLDPQGNYLDSWHLENYTITDLAFDSSQNIIAIGNLFTDLIGQPYYYTATVFKLDNNLNSIWTKYLDGFSTMISSLNVDHHGGLIITGTYSGFLDFAGENLQKANGIFICKFGPDGSEEWILDQGNDEIPGNALQNITIDSNNILYASAQYTEINSFRFKNTSISIIADLPYQGNRDAVLFSFDTNGNYISHFTLTGVSQRIINSFAISEFDEFLIGLGTSGRLIFTNSNGYTTSFDTERENILLKVSPTHQVIEYKEIDIRIRHLQFDSQKNIIMGDGFRKDTDFDPHPINEYMILNNSQPSGYVLKLGYCDTYPPTGDPTNTFCSDDNATIGDLEINEYGVNWYPSLTSTVPLDDTTLLVDGQTYYAAKDKTENCPEIMQRLAVSVTINPVPPAPVLNANQPCYNGSLTLGDLIIAGTNLTFYSTPTTATKLNASTPVNPQDTYYVSQKLQGCESPRTAINIPAQGTIKLNDHAVNLCDNDKNNFERVNLSSYIRYILDDDEDNYTISYHNTLADAQNNSNPIIDYEDFQANNQIIYIRFVFNTYLCFEIATLTINISTPPEIADVIIQDGTSYGNSATILPSNPEYLYSIDGVTYQNSNLFENLPAGEYFAYVKDNKGACPEMKEKFYLLAYPKFFTPNGDGYNDFWKIRYAQFQFTVDVEIYDRYGKLITSFDKNSPGWDGTYNGEQLPSTDYWFKVTRLLDNEIVHKGHFSLKR